MIISFEESKNPSKDIRMNPNLLEKPDLGIQAIQTERKFHVNVKLWFDSSLDEK
jgi:hypothetical protein